MSCWCSFWWCTACATKRLLYFMCHFVFQFPLQNVTPNTSLCLDITLIDGVPSAKKMRRRRRREPTTTTTTRTYPFVRYANPQDSEGRRRRARNRRRAVDVKSVKCRRNLCRRRRDSSRDDDDDDDASPANHHHSVEFVFVLFDGHGGKVRQFTRKKRSNVS